MATIAAAHYALAEKAIQSDPILHHMAKDVTEDVWNGKIKIEELTTFGWMQTANRRWAQLDELNPDRLYKYNGEHGFHIGAIANALQAEVRENVEARERWFELVEQAEADGREVPEGIAETVAKWKSTHNSQA